MSWLRGPEGGVAAEGAGFQCGGVMRCGRGLAQDKSPPGRLIEGNNPPPCRPGVKYNQRGAGLCATVR